MRAFPIRKLSTSQLILHTTVPPPRKGDHENSSEIINGDTHSGGHREGIETSAIGSSATHPALQEVTPRTQEASATGDEATGRRVREERVQTT